MKILLAVLILSGCTTRGTLHQSMGYDTQLVRCDINEPYYGSIGLITNFESMRQEVILSWQCKENNGARKYLPIGEYDLSMWH